VTLLEAPDPPSRLPSNSLFADSVARLVSAATVEATLAVRPAFELAVLLALAAVLAEVAPAAAFSAEAALDALKRVYRAEAWLPLTLPIDITTPILGDCNQGYRLEFEGLEEVSLRTKDDNGRDHCSALSLFRRCRVKKALHLDFDHHRQSDQSAQSAGRAARETYPQNK
jgi:hypothetical protein